MNFKYMYFIIAIAHYAQRHFDKFFIFVTSYFISFSILNHGYFCYWNYNDCYRNIRYKTTLGNLQVYFDLKRKNEISIFCVYVSLCLIYINTLFCVFFDRNQRYEEIKKNATYLYSSKLSGSGNVNCESIELRDLSNDHAIQEDGDRTYIDIIEHESDKQSQHTAPVSDNILNSFRLHSLLN